MGSVSLIVAPVFVIDPILVMIIITGTAIGSLIPDADSVDAAIFHPEVRGINGGNAEVLNAIGFLYPVFGYVTKYLIYKPSVVFYDRLVFKEQKIQERHRGYLHSFLGLVTATVLTGLYLLPVLVYLELFAIVNFVAFLGAYFVGAMFHVFEDSCTKTGIQWNYPFQSWTINGQLTTTAKPEDTLYQRHFTATLGILTGAMFFAPLVIDLIPHIGFSILGVVLVVLLWSGSTKFVAKCKINR